MAERYGEACVIEVLPLCLENEAAQWYTSLDHITHGGLDKSVTGWEREINTYFGCPPTQAKEARCLHYHFYTRQQYPIGSYLLVKLELSREAGLYTEADIKLGSYEGLEPLIRVHSHHSSPGTITQCMHMICEREQDACLVWSEETSATESFQHILAHDYLTDLRL